MNENTKAFFRTAGATAFGMFLYTVVVLPTGLWLISKAKSAASAAVPQE